MLTKEEAHKTLVQARNFLDKRGHTKGILIEQDTGRVCLRGAFLFGCGPQILSYEDELQLADLLGFTACTTSEKYFSMHEAVVWNNRPETTKEDVLQRFDRAIAKTAPEPIRLDFDHIQPEVEVVD